MGNYPQQIASFLLGAIFPVRCIECGLFSPENEKRYLCRKCISLIIPRSGQECIGCERASTLGKTCIECRDAFFVDNLLVVTDYKNPVVERAIKTLKYRFVPEIADSFGPAIKKFLVRLEKDKHFNIFSDNPLFVPIPLYGPRLNLRGFNQAELFAKIISETGLHPVNSDILTRTRSSVPQADIKNRSDRMRNLENIFTLKEAAPIKNRIIVLVDDVCTTGTTLNEAAKILKKNGAAGVIGFVIARG